MPQMDDPGLPPLSEAEIAFDKWYKKRQRILDILHEENGWHDDDIFGEADDNEMYDLGLS